MCLIQAQCQQVGLAADDAVPVRMSGRIALGIDALDEAATRALAILPQLVEHDLPLLLQGLFAEHEPPHAIGFGEQGEVERVAMHGFEIMRAVERGASVEIVCAGREQMAQVGARQILAAAVHEVLEQMRKPMLPGRFVGRADSISHMHGHQRQTTILVQQHAQPVVEAESMQLRGRCHHTSSNPLRTAMSVSSAWLPTPSFCLML